MDACLMNMVEVAYQLRDSVSYIVGPEIEEPFDGCWPYAEILAYLTAKPAKDPATVASEIVKRYIAS
ncbi:MAG: clostripain-related cysteine peptidase, partial [Syntrophales bacterium]|nr:clostripain-related cysteine peptidase [Syntrophales bacterium]